MTTETRVRRWTGSSPDDHRPAEPPLAFGPVRSRRLGWSLGINNVPPKTCSYACVYCQVGATDRSRRTREPFHSPADITVAVARRLAECRAAAQPVDYATFVPDGEPTLDEQLGASIRRIRSLGVRVAVLTNGTLLSDPEVRSEVGLADWVSVKVDTVDQATWHRLNRPIGGLDLRTVLDGIRAFAAGYRGDLVTETMLVSGLNDDDEALDRTSAFVASLAPLRAYVALPTRPPAEPWVRAPAAEVARRAADRFRAAEVPAACLLDEPVAPFPPVGEAVEGLLGIIAVHPMPADAARSYLARCGSDWSVAESLVEAGLVEIVPHQGRAYLRGAHRVRPRSANEKEDAMQPLTKVSHEHHDRLWGYVNQLDEMADCLNTDCLDAGRMESGLQQLCELHDGLTTQLLPHMEAVEAAVHPTLERILVERGVPAPMPAEHDEIRRLVAALGEFTDNPAAHEDRTAVLSLRRVLLRLYVLLKTHLSEEEMYIPILEDRLTPDKEAAIARALDHVAAERL
jgi:wyosine [tRNA(Phe)-imidazoG37] synthetase (radical SAM superfamily)